MKGPYERLKYDFSRVWECPECHHRARSAGTETFHYCACQKHKPPRERVGMRLLEDGPPGPSKARHVNLLPEFPTDTSPRL